MYLILILNYINTYQIIYFNDIMDTKKKLNVMNLKYQMLSVYIVISAHKLKQKIRQNFVIILYFG